MSPPRAIIHVDMDAFYASVETLDNPEHRGKPVIVGGLGRRGVVAAASYEAREFGVHSAMPMARAKRSCPDGVYLRPRMARYREVSRQVFAVFHEFTPLVEGISVDEAWLDVTGSIRLFGDIRAIGQRIKQAVRERTHLVASIGMAPNKFLAKLASDYGKPDGFFEINAEGAREFLAPLPVRRLWGIGPKSAERLMRAGITTIGELEAARTEELAPLLGNSTAHFQALARGEDEREVTPDRPDKSISHEETFEYDLHDLRVMEAKLMELAEGVGTRLRRKSLAGATITVKIRTGAWRTYTRSLTLPEPTATTRVIYRTGCALLEKWRQEYPKPGVRLLGIGASKLAEQGATGLFQADEKNVDSMLDAIRERFGGTAIKRGRLVGDDENPS